MKKLLMLLCCALSSLSLAAPENDLYNAVNRGDISAVDQALAAGADINKRALVGKNSYLIQPLIRAAERGDLAIVKHLIAKKADPNVQVFWGGTALFYVASAPADKRLEVFRWLLENTAIDLNHVANDGRTVVQNAMKAQAYDLVRYALNSSAYKLQATDKVKLSDLPHPEPSAPQPRMVETVTVSSTAAPKPREAATSRYTLDDLKKQAERVEYYRRELSKVEGKTRHLQRQSRHHSEEASAWDEVSHDLGGLTDTNESRRMNEHRKARNADHRAAVVAKQRGAGLRTAYESELQKLRKMAEEYNNAHPQQRYRSSLLNGAGKH